MHYEILSYGSYDVENITTKFKTKEDAKKELKKLAEKWCGEHDIDKDEIDIDDFDDNCFEYGEEECGVVAYEVIEVPDFKNIVDELLWKAKKELRFANYATTDYKWTLMDCMADCHICNAEELIDKAIKLIM